MDSKTRVFLALVYVVVASAQPPIDAPSISPAADTLSTFPASAPVSSQVDASPPGIPIWKVIPHRSPEHLSPPFPISVSQPWVFPSPPAPELPSPPPASVSLTFTPTYQSGAEKLMRNMPAYLTMGGVIFGWLLL